MARQKKPSGKKGVQIKKPECIFLAAKNIIAEHDGNHFQGQRNGTPHTVEVFYTIGQVRQHGTLNERTFHGVCDWRQYITAMLELD